MKTVLPPSALDFFQQLDNHVDGRFELSELRSLFIDENGIPNIKAVSKMTQLLSQMKKQQSRQEEVTFPELFVLICFYFLFF